jgi:hypothetical protein
VIARVFPRRTSMTPTDALVYTDMQPPFTLPEVDEIHISVAFTWDMPVAEQMATAWGAVGVPVKMGGPAFNEPGGDFVPGMYVKEGCVITSRGCPNHCWFCAVPRREGGLRELPIRDGWNVLDDNLLACSDAHVEAVFQMLERQPHKARFTGGLEAKILKPWHAKRLREINPERMYFAYDTPEDYEPLVAAGRRLFEAGFPSCRDQMACYCLIGYRGDTFEKAEKRLRQAWDAGFMPYAMLYRDEHDKPDSEWREFQREWLRPAIIRSKLKKAPNHD